MKKIILKIFDKTINKLVITVGKDLLCKFIVNISRRANIDLLGIAYNDRGILNYKNYHDSGESYLIKKILLEQIGFGKNSVIFDVGANVGNYTKILKESLLDADIYAFEPNRYAFAKLKDSLDETVKCFNIGFGASEGAGKIYTYANSMDSSHSSSYREVFDEIYNVNEISEVEFNITTIDKFCFENNIANIDFVKIDTEGNEYNVLTGAKQMILQGRISAIQFEFGECNVFSRVFLRDFYQILGGYNFYRLNTSGLVPLFGYRVANEIFRYQNIFAIKKEKDSFPRD